MSGVNFAGDDLRLGLERIERLEEEKKGIADDIKDVYAEYKSKGFDVKTMRELIKLRKMDANERREREALLDTYKAALGMLDGTPLGKWAVKKLSKQDDDEEPQEEPDAGDKSGGEPAEPAPPPPTVEEARAMGRTAAQAGQPVTSNPFPARDERRAAWDEEWCKALGSDGMDIPDALKPAPKPKKGAGDEGKPAGGGE